MMATEIQETAWFWWNYKDNSWVRLESADDVTDEIAKECIPQDVASQVIYEHCRFNGLDPHQVMANVMATHNGQTIPFKVG